MNTVSSSEHSHTAEKPATLVAIMLAFIQYANSQKNKKNFPSIVGDIERWRRFLMAIQQHLESRSRILDEIWLFNSSLHNEQVAAIEDIRFAMTIHGMFLGNRWILISPKIDQGQQVLSNAMAERMFEIAEHIPGFFLPE